MTHPLLLEMTEAGFHCPAGDFHIDPWQPVARAVITHAHADHARPGCGRYLATPSRRGPAARPPGAGSNGRGDRVRPHGSHGRRARLAPPGRARPRLRPGAGRAPGRGLGRLRRLQARPGPHLRSVRAAALRTPSSPSAPSACRSIAGPRPPTVIAEIGALVAPQPRSGQRCSVLFAYASARRSACSPARPADRADLHARRGREHDRGLPAGRRRAVRNPDGLRCRPARRLRRGARRRAAARPRARPGCGASAGPQPAFALGLDAHPRQPPPAAARPWLRALRPRRLAGAPRHGARTAAPTGLDDPRLHGRDGAGSCANSGCRGRPGAHRLSRGQPRTDEALRRALRRARRDDARPAARWRRWWRYFRRRPPGRRRLGGRLPDRPQAAPGGAHGARCAAGRRRRPASRTGCSRSRYEAVGDLAETIALLLPAAATRARTTAAAPTGSRAPAAAARPRRRRRSARGDRRLARHGPASQRFVWNKLITGGFRVGVSQKLVTRALPRSAGSREAVIAHRLMGDWEPTPAFYGASLSHAHRRRATSAGPTRSSWPTRWRATRQRSATRGLAGRVEVGRHPRPADPARRAGLPLVARRGTGHGPLPGDRRRPRGACRDGTVLDGEILAWADGRAAAVRRAPAAHRPQDADRGDPARRSPVALLAYDLLELDGEDLRAAAAAPSGGSASPSCWRRLAGRRG